MSFRVTALLIEVNLNTALEESEKDKARIRSRRTETESQDQRFTEKAELEGTKRVIKSNSQPCTTPLLGGTPECA